MEKGKFKMMDESLLSFWNLFLWELGRRGVFKEKEEWMLDYLASQVKRKNVVKLSGGQQKEFDTWDSETMWEIFNEITDELIRRAKEGMKSWSQKLILN